MTDHLAKVKGCVWHTAQYYLLRYKSRDLRVMRRIWVEDEDGTMKFIGEMKVVKTPTQVKIYAGMPLLKNRKKSGGKRPGAGRRKELK